MNDKILMLGAYVKATFDAAQSRGVLTKASLQTMENALINIYGADFFAIQTEEPIEHAGNIMEESKKKVEELKEAGEKVVAKARRQVRKSQTNTQVN